MRQLPDLISAVDDNRKILDQLKLKQFVGSKNLTITETASSNVWDVNQTVNNGNSVKFYFIADNQVGPFAAFRPITLVNDQEWKLTDNNKLYESAIPDPSALGITDQATLTRLAVGQYIISVIGAFNLKMKMRVLANDTGTLGWVVL